jgi:hypothetical protein
VTAVPNADVTEVAKAIVKVVDMPFGTRPFRVHIDPAQDGAEIVNGVAIRVRAELLRNMKLADLLRPSSTRSRLRKRHNVRCPESVTSPTERVGILFAVAGVALEFDVGVQIEHAQGEALPPSSLPAPAYAEERANNHRE